MVSLGLNDNIGKKRDPPNMPRVSGLAPECPHERQPSPVNGITNQECANILREEVDSLKQVRTMMGENIPLHHTLLLMTLPVAGGCSHNY